MSEIYIFLNNPLVPVDDTVNKPHNSYIHSPSGGLDMNNEQDHSCHKTLEERASEYDGNLNLDGELDWRGEPVGDEVW